MAEWIMAGHQTRTIPQGVQAWQLLQFSSPNTMRLFPVLPVHHLSKLHIRKCESSMREVLGGRFAPALSISDLTHPNLIDYVR